MSTAVEKAHAALRAARRRYIDTAIGSSLERALYGQLMAARSAYEAAKDAAWRAANLPKRRAV